MRKTKLLKPFIIVSSLGMLARVTGFARVISLSYLYGAGATTDAFIVAVTIPTIVLSFVGGAAVAVYIPIYQSNVAHKNRLTSNVLNIILLLSLLFAVIFTIFPGVLVRLFAVGFDAETFAITSQFVQILVWCAIPIFAAEILRGYLQLNGNFFSAAVAILITNIFSIAFILLSRYAQNPPLMGFGVLLGDLLCCLFLLWAAGEKGFVYKPYINFRDHYIGQMLVLLAPIMIASFISEVNHIVDRNFASSLPPGGISSLDYASKLITSLRTFIGESAVTVLFPAMSASSASGDTAEIKRYIRTLIMNAVPLLLPLTAAMILLPEPIIKILFERGAFTAEDTARTAECIRMYAPCVIGSNLSPVISRAFHSLKNTRTPALISVLSLCLNIALNALLVRNFAHNGLAFATSVASLLTLVLLYLALRRSIGGIGLHSCIGEFIKALGATTAVSVFFIIALKILPMTSDGILETILYFVPTVVCGAAIYAIAHVVLKTTFSATVRRVLFRPIKAMKSDGSNNQSAP